MFAGLSLVGRWGMMGIGTMPSSGAFVKEGPLRVLAPARLLWVGKRDGAI